MNYITNNKFEMFFPQQPLIGETISLILVLHHLLNEPSVYIKMIFFGGVVCACIILHQGLPAICFKFDFPCMLSCSISCIIWGTDSGVGSNAFFSESFPNCQGFGCVKQNQTLALNTVGMSENQSILNILYGVLQVQVQPVWPLTNIDLVLMPASPHCMIVTHDAGSEFITDISFRAPLASWLLSSLQKELKLVTQNAV